MDWTPFAGRCTATVPLATNGRVSSVESVVSVKRAVNVAANAGVRALLVHALSDDAKLFYEHYGFQASTLHPMTLMLRLPAA